MPTHVGPKKSMSEKRKDSCCTKPHLLKYTNCCVDLGKPSTLPMFGFRVSDGLASNPSRLTEVGERVCHPVHVEHGIDPDTTQRPSQFSPPTHVYTSSVHVHPHRALYRTVHPALRQHTHSPRDVVDRRADGERELPRGRVRHEAVEVVGVAARVGDVLELRHERRVEREHVLVRLPNT